MLPEVRIVVALLVVEGEEGITEYKGTQCIFWVLKMFYILYVGGRHTCMYT